MYTYNSSPFRLVFSPFPILLVGGNTFLNAVYVPCRKAKRGISTMALLCNTFPYIMIAGAALFDSRRFYIRLH